MIDCVINFVIGPQKPLVHNRWLGIVRMISDLIRSTFSMASKKQPTLAQWNYILNWGFPAKQSYQKQMCVCQDADWFLQKSTIEMLLSHKEITLVSDICLHHLPAQHSYDLEGVIMTSWIMIILHGSVKMLSLYLSHQKNKLAQILLFPASPDCFSSSLQLEDGILNSQTI